MKSDNLFDLMQNSAISALALHSFVLGYNKVSKGKNQEVTYPRIEYLFFVLPIVYNKNALNIFQSSDQLFTAISKDNSITLGLQERANKMSAQTFNGLNIAFSKKILNYNKELKIVELLQGFKSEKIQFNKENIGKDNSVKNIQIAAYKLGSIFAKRNEKNIQIELNINF
jgi:Family of unknown function (DUF6521)